MQQTSTRTPGSPRRHSRCSMTPGSRRCMPEKYGGQGADAVATGIVIEEVARVCASSSLIPGVNKLGTIGLILSGSDELKKQVLPTLASGDAMASYALSEREAGSDPAAMRTRARADGDEWVLNGTKQWITNGGKPTSTPCSR